MTRAARFYRQPFLYPARRAGFFCAFGRFGPFFARVGLENPAALW